MRYFTLLTLATAVSEHFSQRGRRPLRRGVMLQTLQVNSFHFVARDRE